MVSAKSECKVGCCAKSAVTDLAGQELCLEHFLASCHERMDNLEPLVCGPSLGPAENTVACAFLEECSKRALLICLRHEYLTNVDRSQLLNILLQAGHLQLQLRKPVIQRPGPVSGLSDVFFGRIPAKTLGAEDRENT